MKREELQKLLSVCDNDDDFARVVRMASNEVQNDTLNKPFMKNGEHEILAALMDQNRHRKYSTGWKKLDEYAMPRSGKITLIPAYTHHGKSVMSMNMAYNMWKQYEDRSIIYYSFESDLYDVASFFARLWYHDKYEMTSTEYISIDEWERRTCDRKDELHAIFMAAVADFTQRLFIREDRISASQLDGHIRRLIDNNDKVSVVFVDYFQDMKLQEHTGDERTDIEQMVVDIECIAKDYGVAVILPAQYKRHDGYMPKDPDKKLLIGEHRIFGSSAMSKKADVIYSLFNDTVFDYQFKGADRIVMIEELEVDILKARKQNYAKNLTLCFNRRTGKILESTRVIQQAVQND